MSENKREEIFYSHLYFKTSVGVSTFCIIKQRQDRHNLHSTHIRSLMNNLTLTTTNAQVYKYTFTYNSPVLQYV
jgi:hypothetical protein